MSRAATVKDATTFTPTPVQQQVFALSCLSNRAQDQMEADLQAWAPHIGAWEIVWGPCFTPPPPPSSQGTAQVNAMFVAQAVNAAQPTYVVAIAGTNPGSPYDWWTEDLDISPTSWQYAVESRVIPRP